jgi:hypothetical protein
MSSSHQVFQVFELALLFEECMDGSYAGQSQWASEARMPHKSLNDSKDWASKTRVYGIWLV